MIYLVICLWVLGSILCYASLAEEPMEIGEKVAWIVLWPFLTAVGIALGSGVWLYEIITGNKVRF